MPARGYASGNRYVLWTTLTPRSDLECSRNRLVWQFAYNEMSFFLIRLLQHFSHMELDLSAQPDDARPPPEWVNEEGHRSKEKITPKTHLTLYVQVGTSIPPVHSMILWSVCQILTYVSVSGWPLGEDD